MIQAKMVHVKRVRVRKEVRCHSLISLREFSPSHTMFRIHYSSLDRCVTFGVSMVTFIIVVSFFPCETTDGVPQTFPFPTLEAFVVRYYLSYSVSTTA